MNNQKVDFSQIVNNSDIVDIIGEEISLTKKGKDYVGLCPFHPDSNPSMSVSAEKRIFKCFSCNKAGDVVRYLMLKKGYTYLEAIKNLAERQGIILEVGNYSNQAKLDPSQQENIQILSDFNAYFKATLLTKQQAWDYCVKRRLSNQIREKFNIGFIESDAIINFGQELKYDKVQLHKAGLLNSDLYPIFKNRLSFAISNEYGQVVGFSARTLNADEKPKYINSIESSIFNKSKILYNYNNAKEEIKATRKVYLTEGFMDTIALDSIGYHNTVALMGTALTQDQINLIKGNEVILFLDNDTAGLNATKKSISLLLKNRVKTYVINNKFSKDPDEILTRYGKDQLVDLLENHKQIAIDYIYNWLVNFYNLSANESIENIEQFNKEFSDFLKYENDSVKEFYSNKFHTSFKVHLKLPKVSHYDEFDYEPLNNSFANNNYQSEIEQRYQNTNKYSSSFISYSDKHFNKPTIIKSTEDILLSRDALVKILVNLFNNFDFFKFFIEKKYYEEYRGLTAFLKVDKYFVLLNKIIEQRNELILEQKFIEFQKNKFDFENFIINQIALSEADFEISIDDINKLIWVENEQTPTVYERALNLSIAFLNNLKFLLYFKSMETSEDIEMTSKSNETFFEFLSGLGYKSFWMVDENFVKDFNPSIGMDEKEKDDLKQRIIRSLIKTKKK